MNTDFVLCQRYILIYVTWDSDDCGVQVILIGGGSRVPRVQEILTEYVGRELGKNMNTDESAAMGAVYKAADLSTGFYYY